MITTTMMIIIIVKILITIILTSRPKVLYLFVVFRYYYQRSVMIACFRVVMPVCRTVTFNNIVSLFFCEILLAIARGVAARSPRRW